MPWSPTRDAAVGDIEMLDVRRARRVVLGRGMRPRTTVEPDATLVELFDSQVAATPDRGRAGRSTDRVA